MVYLCLFLSASARQPMPSVVRGSWSNSFVFVFCASVIFKTEIVVISSLSPDYCHTITPPDVWKAPRLAEKRGLLLREGVEDVECRAL